LEVELIEDDGVTSAGTILLDATGMTDALLDGAIEVPGGEWYYVRVDTTDAGSGAVGGVRLYEEASVAVLSIEYTDRTTLLADTGQSTGATGYVPSYAAPVEVWQWDGSDWLLVAAEWDGVTSGQAVADLLTYDGLDGAFARVGSQDLTWESAEWRYVDVGAPTPGGGQTYYDVWRGLPTAAVEGARARLGAQVYRYGRAVTVDAGAGGGTRAVWLPEEWYLGTPVIHAWLDGTEANDAAANARGFVTPTVTGSATRTWATGAVEMACTAANAVAAIQTLIDDIAAGTRVGMLAGMRGTVAAGLPAIGALIGDGTNALRIYQRGDAYSGALGAIRAVGDTIAFFDETMPSLGSPLPGTAAAPELVTISDAGRTVIARVVREGSPYLQIRRAAGTVAVNRAQFFAAPSTGASCRLDAFTPVVVTW
jgi:hypothetical protein